MKAAPLLPWIAANKDGTVLCSHCTCMAGSGEACSYIAAILFAIETYNRLSNNDDCTSQLCAWLPPTLQNVHFAPIAEIDFNSPSTKRRRSMSQEVRDLEATRASTPSRPVPPTLDEELSTF